MTRRRLGEEVTSLDEGIWKRVYPKNINWENDDNPLKFVVIYFSHKPIIYHAFK
jgi:hypothetical protein